jgi:spermidine synthase
VTFRPSRVTALLFLSGACALIYQVAWFRELRLIFGASTAASAAVLAVFMGGLGAGGAILGRRADREKNPLLMYATLELGVAMTAALTPALVWLARAAYLGIGGASTLGNGGATVLRLLLSVVVLLPSTFLMGGTMPAAARAVEVSSDAGRRRVATLYGVNTFGAVAGTVAANFLLLEVLGTRLTLWSAALVNLLVGITARSLARHPEAEEIAAQGEAPEATADEATNANANANADANADADADADADANADADADADAGADANANADADASAGAPTSAPATSPSPTRRAGTGASPAADEEDDRRVPTWLPPAAAAVAGGSFMLMELVWYRMLAPLLGGSSYTFGLILAVALTGIGIGGALYGKIKAPATPRAFALTCALEAAFIAAPFALGDRLAVLSALLRPLAKAGFGWSIGAWTFVSIIVVLPAAIVSGAQFPLIIALYGRGARSVGRHVGAAYLANTLGGIAGSIAGGFGLVPLLGAPGCWKLVVGSLVAAAFVALWAEVLTDRASGAVPFHHPRSTAIVFALTAFAGACFLTRGPTAVWRHAGIGAGRADLRLQAISTSALEGFRHTFERAAYWEEDGVESTVALLHNGGFVFVVNGKADGHAVGDAGTQVMSGVLGALMHPAPKRALVIGLGTGSTAGWLGAIDSIDQVDVIELEPAILRVARDCAPVNRDVMNNPKVKTTLGDAREVLRTSRGRYDVIFSEPSNPYRAGISSMYTAEFYTSAAERLEKGGLFMQWMQAYEVEPWVVATVVTTLHQVFPHMTLWQTMGGDLLLIAGKEPLELDAAALRARIKTEPFASALAHAWHTDTLEGVISHFQATSAFADIIVDRKLGSVNTDDQNVLEFAFARSVGSNKRAEGDIQDLARRLAMTRPAVVGHVDWDRVAEERWLFEALSGLPLDPPPDQLERLPLGRVIDATRVGQHAVAGRIWASMGRAPSSYGERTVVAEIMAMSGTTPAHAALLDLAPNETERDLFRARWATRHGNLRAAEASVESAVKRLRVDPWVRQPLIGTLLGLARDLARRDPPFAARLFDLMSEPFAVHLAREDRLMTRLTSTRLLADVPRCVQALAELEPPLWDRVLFETRVACYAKASDPRATGAEKDLIAYLDVEGTFGASIPSAVEPDAGAPAAPVAVVDDAGTPGADAASPTTAGADAGAVARDGGARPDGGARAPVEAGP